MLSGILLHMSDKMFEVRMHDTIISIFHNICAFG
jgi:hypothetical protein